MDITKSEIFNEKQNKLFRRIEYEGRLLRIKFFALIHRKNAIIQ